MLKADKPALHGNDSRLLQSLSFVALNQAIVQDVFGERILDGQNRPFLSQRETESNSLFGRSYFFNITWIFKPVCPIIESEARSLPLAVLILSIKPGLP